MTKDLHPELAGIPQHIQEAAIRMVVSGYVCDDDSDDDLLAIYHRIKDAPDDADLSAIGVTLWEPLEHLSLMDLWSLIDGNIGQMREFYNLTRKAGEL